MSSRCRFAKPRTGKISICAEPFRILFPIGTLASVIGVSLWPLVYAGVLNFYPAEAHSRLMIEGFVGGFAMGFIATAFPKMIGSPHLSWQELSIVVAALVGCIASHALDLTAAGDCWFLFAWITLGGCLATRLCFFREDLPPPGFVLAGMGLVAGLTGVTILLVGRLVLLSAFQRDLATLLLHEAFILGPILGIGGFLFPRFFTGGKAGSAGSLTWGQRARLALVVGLLVLASYIAQACGQKIWPSLARAAIVAAYLLAQVRAFHRGGSSGSLSLLLRGALASLGIGTAVAGMFPSAAASVKHLLFIGGYGMLILAVASRVTWGHSGNIHLAAGKRRPLTVIFWLLVIAIGTRVVAGFIPAIRVSHHIYAAILWVLATGIWSWAVLRYVRVADPDDSPT